MNKIASSDFTVDNAEFSKPVDAISPATPKNSVVAKLMKAWESKLTQRTTKGAGFTLMAVSLAACNDDDTVASTPSTPATPVTPVDPAVSTTVSANMAAANPAIASDGTTNANDTLVVRPDVLDDLTSITGPYAALRILHDGVDATLTNGLAVSNITTVSVEDINGVDTNIDASEITGITNFKLEDVTTVDVTVTDLQATSYIIHLIDVDGAGTVTLDYDADVVAGTADAITVKAQEMSQSLTIDAGIETITIDVLAETTATASNITALTSTGAETLNITGGTADVAFTITGALEDGLTVVDASTSVSDLSLNMSTADREEATVTLGSGDDTLTLGDTLDEDTIVGGAGDDTVVAVFTNVGTRMPTMSGVEVLDLTFDESATVDMRNVDDVTTIEIRESDERISLENMDATVTAINVYELQSINHAIEYATGEDGQLTLTWNVDAVDEAAVGTLSFDELLTLDLVFTSERDVAGTAISYDDADTEEVTIRNADKGDVTFTSFGTTSSAVTDLTLSTADIGTLSLGSFAEAEALENLTVNASYGDLTVTTIGNTGAAADLDEWTTTGRNDANVGYGVVTATGATLSFLKADAENDSVITYAAIGAEDITLIDVSVTDDAEVDMAGIITATEVTEIDVDGEGIFRMDAVNAVTTIDEIDVSGMGANATSVIVVSATTSDMTINSGEGDHTFTLGRGESTIVLIDGEGTDSFIQNATVAGTQVFTNFETTDDIDLSVAGIIGNDFLAGVTDVLVDIGVMTSDIVATDTVSIVNLAGATDLDNIADTANVVHVDGDYANVAAMVDALEDNGAFELTFDGAMATTDLFLVLWDDGTDSYLSAVGTGATIADDATAAAGDLSGFDIITFNGIADADDISAAMLGGAFIA